MDYNSTILMFLWSFLILTTHELQPSHTQVLLQLRKQLEFPNQLDYWPNHGHDLCYLPSPQVNITCQDNSVTGITIHGTRDRALSPNFSINSLVATLSRIQTLEALTLMSLGIWGSIPDQIHRLESLQFLDLSWNYLHGSIPPTLSRIKKLQILTLDCNVLNATLPDWFDAVSNLTILSLSNNSFSGEIPAELFALPDITSLNLSSNALMGSLPPHLSCGSNLIFVDISNNRLTGPLPSCLKDKKVINFDGNCLSSDLGHQHPETYCTDRSKESKKSQGKKNVKILLAAIIGGIAVLVAAFLTFGSLVLCRQTSEQHLFHKSVQENVITGDATEPTNLGLQPLPPHRPFTLDELRTSTNNFDSSTLMGENSTGKMYKGRLETGSNVAIRCLTLSKHYTIRNLKLRLDLLSKLRHPNLVCLLGHCIDSEGKQESGANKVYLIYEYLPKGNYRECLRETDAEKALKWSDRLAILMDIAKAVHFLHTGIIPGFFCNGLKASNVLINKYGRGKLSDYGLSLIVQDIDKDEQENSLRDDIYSFGLILQESIVGPFQLNERAYSRIPEGMIDPIVLASSCQKSLSNIISLTMKCVSLESSSSSRPSFEDIIWGLQQAEAAQVQAASDGYQITGKTLVST